MTTNENPAYTEDDVEAGREALIATREYMAGAAFGVPADARDQYSKALSLAAVAAVAPGIAARAVEARLAAVAAVLDEIETGNAMVKVGYRDVVEIVGMVRAALGVDPAAHERVTLSTDTEDALGLPRHGALDTRCTVVVNGRRCVLHEDHIEGIGGDVEHRPENPRYGGQG